MVESTNGRSSNRACEPGRDSESLSRLNLRVRQAPWERARIKILISSFARRALNAVSKQKDTCDERRGQKIRGGNATTSNDDGHVRPLRAPLARPVQHNPIEVKYKNNDISATHNQLKIYIRLHTVSQRQMQERPYEG